MKTIAALACFIAVASAQNWMMGNNMMGNNMGMNQNNMMQQMMNNMGMNNMGMNNMYGQNGGQGQQQQQQNNMNNQMVNSLLGNMLGTMLIQGLRGQGMQANMGNNMGNNQGNNMGMDELERLEELAKMSMASELFEVMRAYNQFKDAEQEFSNAGEALCLMVNATYIASQRYNFNVYNVTTEETAERIMQETSMMTKEEKMEYIIDKMVNEAKLFEEMFFRMASWVCWSGQNYVNAAQKLERMERGDRCSN